MAVESLIPALAPAIRQLPQSEEDQGVVAHLFGIPVGFQFGTAAGLTGVPAFLVDVLTDPTTYLLGGFNTLTKFGKAAQGVGKLAKFGMLAEEVQKGGRFGQALKTLAESRAIKPGARASRLLQLTEDSAKLSTKPYQDLLGAVRGLEKNDVLATLRKARDVKPGQGALVIPRSEIERAIGAFERDGAVGVEGYLSGQIARRQQLAATARTALENGDLQAYQEAAKEIRTLKVDPRFQRLFSKQAVGRLESAFKLYEETGKPIAPLAGDAATQAALTTEGMTTPQRALLQVKVPMLPAKTIAVGQSLIERGSQILSPVTKWLPKTPGMVPGARVAAQALARQRNDPKYLAGFDSLYEASAAAGKSIADSARQSLDAMNLSPEAQELVKNRADLLRYQTQAGHTWAGTVAGELEAVLDAKGLKAPEERAKISALLEEPDKFLSRPGGKTGKGPFGETSIFGDLTDSAKKAGYTDDHVLIADAISSGLKTTKNEMQAAGVLNAFQEDYIHRIVTPIGKKGEEALQGFVSRVKTKTFAPAMQKRTGVTYPELLEMEKKGLLTVEKDPARLLHHYYGSTAKVLADGNFIKGVASDRVPFEVTTKAGDKADELLPLILPGGERKWTKKYLATEQYVPSNDPYLTAFARQIGTVTGQKSFFTPVENIYVYKDIAAQLKASLETGGVTRKGVLQTNTDKLYNSALMISSLGKRTLLFPGTWHYSALTERAIVVNGMDGARNAWELTKGQLQKGQKSPLLLFKDADVWMKHGLGLGPPTDAEFDVFNRFTRWAGSKLPVAKPVFDAMASADLWVGKKLWSQYHNPSKLFAAETMMGEALKKFPNLPEEQIRRAISEHVNNAFGGGVLERMVSSKKGQQWMRLFFLAPDWTLSNISVAADVFANFFKKQEWFQQAAGRRGWIFSPEEVMKSDVRAFFARQYALRSSLMLVGAASLVNAAFTGHFIWDNAEGHQSQIQLPWKDSNGRHLYLDFAKAFREPFEWVAGPFESINRKMGTLPRVAWAQVSGKDFFGQPIVTQEDGPLANLAKRVGYIAGGNMPIGLQELVGFRKQAKDATTAGMMFAGLPIKTEFVRFREDGSPVEHVTKTKQELRDEVKAEYQDQIKQQTEKWGEALDALMKSGAYRSAIGRRQEALLMSVAPSSGLAVAE